MSDSLDFIRVYRKAESMPDTYEQGASSKIKIANTALKKGLIGENPKGARSQFLTTAWSTLWQVNH